MPGAGAPGGRAGVAPVAAQAGATSNEAMSCWADALDSARRSAVSLLSELEVELFAAVDLLKRSQAEQEDAEAHAEMLEGGDQDAPSPGTGADESEALPSPSGGSAAGGVLADAHTRATDLASGALLAVRELQGVLADAESGAADGAALGQQLLVAVAERDSARAELLLLQDTLRSAVGAAAGSAGVHAGALVEVTEVLDAFACAPRGDSSNDGSDDAPLMRARHER
eukprot:61176-Chlamydomonas_euryale.AAC.1